MKRRKNIAALFMVASVLATCACSKSETSKEKNKKNKEPIESIEEQSIPEDTYSEVAESSSEINASSETEETTVKVRKDKIHISDGPICAKTENGITSFYQLSLESGEEYIFFQVAADQNVSYGLGWRSYILPQIFDSTYSRIVVSLEIDETTKEEHVGWIDRNGVVTDVTSIIHPQSDDFSSITPTHIAPHFDSQDHLVYFDVKENAFFYFDEATQSEVMIQDLDEGVLSGTYRWNRLDETSYLEYDSNQNSIGYLLDFDDRIEPLKVIRFRDDITIYRKALEEYFEHDGGYTFFVIFDGALYHGGTGITPVTEFEESDGTTRKEYVFDTIVSDEFRITPESEWQIYSMYYLDGMIYFKATKNNEDAWFEMSYSEGVAGSPVKIEDEEEIEKVESYYYAFFRWDFRDIEVPVIG